MGIPVTGDLWVEETKKTELGSGCLEQAILKMQVSDLAGSWCEFHHVRRGNLYARYLSHSLSHQTTAATCDLDAIRRERKRGRRERTYQTAHASIGIHLARSLG